MIPTRLLCLALVAGVVSAAAVPGAERALAPRAQPLARKKCTPRPHSTTAPLAPKVSTVAPKPTTQTPKPTAKAPTPTSAKPAPQPTVAPKPTSVVAPKPTSVVPAPKPVPTTPPVNKTSTRKVGLAWNNGLDSSLHMFTSDRVLGLHNWSPWCNSEATKLGIACFPMLWGDQDIPAWTQVVKPGYATHALGCNEVNQPGQSQMTPQHGADLWRTYIAPLRQHGYTVGSHSVSSAPSGQDWFDEYFRVCPDCKASTDLLNVHYYGTSADGFIAYITQMHTRYGLPIIVTEFACNSFGSDPQCSASQVRDFLDATTRFMDAQPWVYGYFYFGLFENPPGGVTKENAMIGGNGTPTALGMDYIN